MENANQRKSKNIVYGFDDEKINIVFNSKEAAERYNKLYYKGYLTVKAIESYSDCEDYDVKNPREHLARLTREKGDLLNVILFPFIVVRKSVGGSIKRSEGGSFLFLKEMLTSANELLREKYDYPQDVKDDEMLKLDLKRFEINLSAGECITLYKIFKEVNRKANELNKQIAEILANEDISEEEYQEILKDSRLSEANSDIALKSYEFEMLEKESYAEREYMSLE